jgi:hypothetical protein
VSPVGSREHCPESPERSDGVLPNVVDAGVERRDPAYESAADQASWAPSLLTLSASCPSVIQHRLLSSSTRNLLARTWVVSRSPSTCWGPPRSFLGWSQSLERTSSRRRSWRLRYANKHRCAGKSSRAYEMVSNQANDPRRRQSRRIAKATSSSLFKRRVFSWLSPASSNKPSGTRYWNA